MRSHVTTPLVVVALLVAGCSEEQPTAVKTVPGAQRVAMDGAAIVVRGDYAPDEHGPFTFAGRYQVRFAQRGAGVDFRAEVPFTAHLEQPDADGPGKRVMLFQTAARTGATVVTARGRFRVVVDFGDSPYEIRFTKAGGEARASRAVRACGALVSQGTRYPVEVDSGDLACADAVATLRAYLRDGVAPDGWSCARGHFGQPYAAHCARAPDGDVVVEARNPTALSAPPTARRGAPLAATASGLRAGRYTLTLVADAAPARGARCLANVGSPRSTTGGWVALRGVVPRRLRCYQGARIFLGAVPAHAGAYHLVVGVKLAPAAWDVKRSFLRRRLRVR